MRTASEWLDEYAKSHQNPLNRRIHTICVPLIYWSIFALLGSRGFLWFAMGAAVALAFYFTLGTVYFIAMTIATALSLGISLVFERLGWPLALIAIIVFSGAWIGQFYGHKVEGKRPSFLTDLLFLLVGPIWVLKELELLPHRR